MELDSIKSEKLVEFYSSYSKKLYSETLVEVLLLVVLEIGGALLRIV